MVYFNSTLQFASFVQDDVLNLSHQSLTDADVPAFCAFLTANPHIQTLNVSHNQLTQFGAEYLSRMTTIKSLNVSYNKLGKEGAREIAKMIHLIELDISGNNIGSAGILAVASLQYYCLTKLTIESQPSPAPDYATAMQARHIKGLPDLQVFSFFAGNKAIARQPEEQANRLDTAATLKR